MKPLKITFTFLLKLGCIALIIALPLESCKKIFKDSPIEGTNWSLTTSGAYQTEIRFYDYNYRTTENFYVGAYKLVGHTLTFEINSAAIDDFTARNYRFIGTLNSDFTEMTGETTCIANCEDFGSVNGSFKATRISKD